MTEGKHITSDEDTSDEEAPKKKETTTVTLIGQAAWRSD
jgi:hypothetical protein